MTFTTKVVIFNVIKGQLSTSLCVLFQIYSYVSLTFVIIDIFSFVTQTHKFFRIEIEYNPKTTINSSIHTLLHPNDSFVTPSYDDNITNYEDVHPGMLVVDAICLLFFLTEFILRLLLAPIKCKFLSLPITIFEILALLPDIIEFAFRFFRPEQQRQISRVDIMAFLRLLRVFRILRLIRHFPGLWILFYTLQASVKELLLLLLFLCVGMLFFASLIYYVDDRSRFTSIPTACWWAVITMTTVGYGDMYPTTGLGYVVGCLTAICGVLVIGFTVPVLVNNFMLYYQHTQCSLNRNQTNKRCKNNAIAVRDIFIRHSSMETTIDTCAPENSARSGGLTLSTVPPNVDYVANSLVVSNDDCNEEHKNENTGANDCEIANTVDLNNNNNNAFFISERL